MILLKIKNENAEIREYANNKDMHTELKPEQNKDANMYTE